MGKKWMQGAVRPGHKGELTRKAKAAGMGTQQFAQAHKHDSGKTGQQARFAVTAAKISKGK